MGSFANTLFTVLLGWMQGAVSTVWSAFTSEKGNSFFNWIGRHWILIAGILCVIGLVSDLCVYLLRWKPFQVWKSFLFRNRKKEEAEEENGGRPYLNTYRAPERPREVSAPVPRTPVSRREEPDLSQWEKEEPAEEPRAAKREEAPATVTGAGYVVPADSPYRRPVHREQPAAAEENRRMEETGPFREEKPEPIPVPGRRHRRISVSDLFADPEEELKEIAAPQDIIDSQKAYREPVYPRGWKQNEDHTT